MSVKLWNVNNNFCRQSFSACVYRITFSVHFCFYHLLSSWNSKKSPKPKRNDCEDKIFDDRSFSWMAQWFYELKFNPNKIEYKISWHYQCWRATGHRCYDNNNHLMIVVVHKMSYFYWLQVNHSTIVHISEEWNISCQTLNFFCLKWHLIPIYTLSFVSLGRSVGRSVFRSMDVI